MAIKRIKKVRGGWRVFNNTGKLLKRTYKTKAAAQRNADKISRSYMGVFWGKK